MVRPLFIPAFWPRPHPFQVQIVPVSDVSQLVWLLCVAVTLLKFPRTAVIQNRSGKRRILRQQRQPTSAFPEVFEIGLRAGPVPICTPGPYMGSLFFKSIPTPCTHGKGDPDGE